MASKITKGDLKKLKSNIMFKGKVSRGVRWSPGSRGDKAEAKAWARKIEEMKTKEK